MSNETSSEETQSLETGETANESSRILVVQAPAQWTGAIEEQDFLRVPAGMDVAKEEAAWFASGGDSSGKSFAVFLLEKGAVKLSVEIWNINYQ